MQPPSQLPQQCRQWRGAGIYPWFQIRSRVMAVGQGVSASPSLYRKVADDIKAAIAAGGYLAGTRLPSEAELAERYSVSRGTIRQAFAALRAGGGLPPRRGARRVVSGGRGGQGCGGLLSSPPPSE